MNIIEMTASVNQIGLAVVGLGFFVGTAVIFGLAWARGLLAPYDGMKETNNERIARASRNRRLGH